MLVLLAVRCIRFAARLARLLLAGLRCMQFGFRSPHWAAVLWVRAGRLELLLAGLRCSREGVRLLRLLVEEWIATGFFGVLGLRGGVAGGLFRIQVAGFRLNIAAMGVGFEMLRVFWFVVFAAERFLAGAFH